MLKRMYIPDECRTREAKNAKMRELLAGKWARLAIIRIRRVESGRRHGWEVHYGDPTVDP